MTSGTDTNFDGLSANGRPDQIGNFALGGHRGTAAKAAEFFNIAAFASVPPGTATGLGTTQFDLIPGPGTVNTDLAAAKSFPIWKENALMFRAEAFNVFNNVNLDAPTAVLSSAKDGVITGANPARVLEFALRYSF